MTAPLILASKSASRRAMLDAAGVAYQSIPADIDERAVEAGLAGAGPAEVAEALSVAKAAAVVVRRPVIRRMACRWLVRLWVPLHCRVPWLSLQLSLTGSVGSHLLVLVPGAGMALTVNVNPSVLIGIPRPVVVVKVP